MNLGMETETVEFKKSTGELKEACIQKPELAKLRFDKKSFGKEVETQ